MLKEYIVDLALLVGPSIRRAGECHFQPLVKTRPTGVSTIRETKILELRPHWWQKKIAEFVLGCSLDNVGADIAPRKPDRFVWYTKDEIDGWENLESNENTRGVYKDEMRTDVQRLLKTPLEYFSASIVPLKRTAALYEDSYSVREISPAYIKEVARSAARLRLQKKLNRLLCLTNPLPYEKYISERPASTTAQADKLLPTR